ncbi:MAG: hypothetical protein ACXVYC_12800 [Blastococcus sp.]
MIFYGRDPRRILLVQFVFAAVVIWALLALLGEHGIAGTGGLLGATLGMELSSRRQFGSWAERRAVADAVRSGRDPGPDYRRTVDRIARKQVAVAERVLGLMFLLIFLGGLGVACLVTAFIRGDWSLVWPATALLLGTAFLIVAERRATCRARAWLADPPPVTVGSDP